MGTVSFDIRNFVVLLKPTPISVIREKCAIPPLDFDDDLAGIGRVGMILLFRATSERRAVRKTREISRLRPRRPVYVRISTVVGGRRLYLNVNRHDPVHCTHGRTDVVVSFS